MPSYRDRGKRFLLYGWMLFLVCSLLFINNNAVSGNPLAVAGSVPFLLGYVIFLIN